MAALLAERMRALGTENAFKLGEDIQRCLDRGIDVVRFNLGEPDFDSAPHINQVAVEQIEAGNSHYCDPAGILPFREAIARHVSSTRAIPVDPGQVIVTPGGKPPIGYTFQTYVNPGDEVIYPSPGFPIYESWATYVDAVPVPLMLAEERGFAFTPEDLDALITERTKVIFLCSPSNPTGGVLPRGLLEGIGEVVRARCGPEVRIYSDEIYEHILFDRAEHHSIASEEAMAERTVLASGLSKGFAMTGWRLGWAVLPTEEEAAMFKQLNINVVSCVPPFIQHAGREAYESSESEAAVTEMVKEFEQRRDWVVPALNQIDGVRCQQPKGAFYVFPNVEGMCANLGILDAYETLSPESKAATSPSGMLQMFLLYSYGVATMDRNSFGNVGVVNQHFLRLSIATGLSQLQEGIGRMDRAASDREGFVRFLEEERLWS